MGLSIPKGPLHTAHTCTVIFFLAIYHEFRRLKLSSIEDQGLGSLGNRLCWGWDRAIAMHLDKTPCDTVLLWMLVMCIAVMGAPLWSLITLMVMPVVGELTAIRPSVPPDRTTCPAEKKDMRLSN